MPSLTLLAGPNGAGKTTFIERFKRKNLLPRTVINLDNIPDHVYNKVTGNVYNYKRDLDRVRHEFFEKQCREAIKEGVDFSYECNLRKDQLHQVKYFDEAEYKLILVFIYLKSIDISIQRVKKRANKMKGIYISEDNIRNNYIEGLANLNLTYNEWDELYIINNSRNFNFEKDNPVVEVILEKGKVVEKNITELYTIKQYIPNIFNQV